MNRAASILDNYADDIRNAVSDAEVVASECHLKPAEGLLLRELIGAGMDLAGRIRQEQRRLESYAEQTQRSEPA